MNIAIVGATGLVGSTFLSILEERNVAIDNLYLYASSKSKGKIISFNNQDIEVLELSVENILNKEIDYALFSAGGNISLQFANVFTSTGAIVIDNSSAFRMDDDVPLVVPEVNMVDGFGHLGIIANPNCSTIQSVLPLEVLKQKFGLKSVRYTTYQAVSGSGLNGINDLKRTSDGKSPQNYKYPIYNNVIPQIDIFLDNGYTKEEMKMIKETRKILNMKDLDVTATCVRVPVENSHSVEVHVELQTEVKINTVRELLDSSAGIKVVDDIKNEVYPLATDATGTDEVYVGRIRKDINNAKRLHMFVVSDNIRKGAALNAIQIMEELQKGVI